MSGRWIVHLVSALVLGALLLLATVVAASLTPIVGSLVSRIVIPVGAVPGPWGRLALAMLTAMAMAATVPLLRVYAIGGIRKVVVISLTWAFVGAVAWLAVMFFAGLLPTIDRVYVLVYVAIVAVMLIAARFVLIGDLLFWRAIPLAAGAAVIALWSGWPSSGSVAVSDYNLAAAAVLPGMSWLLTSYLTAAVAASMLVQLALPSGTALFMQFIIAGLWIVLVHSIWLVLLFAFGAVDISRLLPVVTTVVMGAAASGAPLARLVAGGPRGAVASLVGDRAAWPAGAEIDLKSPTTRPGGRNGKRAWIISFTGVSNEPRVLRQSAALVEAGWEVVVCGYDGHSPRPPEWTFVRLPSTTPYEATGLKTLALLEKIGRNLAVHAAAFPPVANWGARLAHASTPLWLHTKSELLSLASTHPGLKADLVISHDYHTSDTGHALAQAFGAKFAVDVHEYAAGQYFNDPQWVRWQRPVAVAVQKSYLSRADAITVVCQGIADLLRKENPLKVEPITIRSVPFKNVQPFRPVGKRIEVLYHGDLSVRREIHTLIESMRHWRSDIDLRLRGSGDPAYIADLKRRIGRLNLESRVVFEPPVPFHDIVPAANKSDIGFFSFKGDSPQIRFTLPNKFFEYVMAGLCLCVGNTEEVGRLVRDHKLGALIETHSSEAIAEAINNLSRESIEASKKASIAAAAELNWEVERKRMLVAYEAALAA